MKHSTRQITQSGKQDKKKSESKRKENQKSRMAGQQRKIRTKKSNKKRRKRHRNKRPRNSTFAGKRFYTLESYLLFAHKLLKEVGEKHFVEKGRQSKYPVWSCWMACMVRCVLGLAHLSQLVDRLESNQYLGKAMGCKRPFKNTKPLTEFLVKWSVVLVQKVFTEFVLLLQKQGQVFGNSVSLDCCFLHVYGKTYEKAQKGYSGQLQRTANGYKLWVVFSVESRMPLYFRLDSGNYSDLEHAKECVQEAGKVLGKQKLKYVHTDRGFCSREWFHWLAQSMGVTFVNRVKGGQSHAYIQRHIDELKPCDYRRIGHRVKYARIKISVWEGFDCHLFVGHTKGFSTPLLLLTNDLSMEWREAQRRYLSRWSIETFFSQEKGNFALGKFTGTKWIQVQGDVCCSLITYMLLKAWRFLLGRRYQDYSAKEVVERILLHGFGEPLEQCLRPSAVKKDELNRILSRILQHLERWDTLPAQDRFSTYRRKEASTDGKYPS